MAACIPSPLAPRPSPLISPCLPGNNVLSPCKVHLGRLYYSQDFSFQRQARRRRNFGFAPVLAWSPTTKDAPAYENFDSPAAILF
ncbi:MAG: hypothetical protein BWX73_00266 [Lentisphaerae bacterium ADurb.Bin082]|nr:MAG: hypothetical protein BWX73_00266 [Lentisphaerae bacterium ADurb.Bin082]